MKERRLPVGSVWAFHHDWAFHPGPVRGIVDAEIFMVIDSRPQEALVRVLIDDRSAGRSTRRSYVLDRGRMRVLGAVAEDRVSGRERTGQVWTDTIRGETWLVIGLDELKLGNWYRFRCVSLDDGTPERRYELKFDGDATWEATEYLRRIA